MLLLNLFMTSALGFCFLLPVTSTTRMHIQPFSRERIIQRGTKWLFSFAKWDQRFFCLCCSFLRWRTKKERRTKEERKKDRTKERKKERNGKKSKIFNPIFCFNYSLFRLCEQQTGKRKMFQKVSGKQDNLHGPPPPPPRPLRPQLRMFLIWKQSVNRVQIYLMSAIISCTKQEQRQQQQQQQQQQQRLTRVARRRWRRCYTLAKWK